MKVPVHQKIDPKRVPDIVAEKYYKRMLPVYGIFILMLIAEVCTGQITSPFVILWTGIRVYGIFFAPPFRNTIGELHLEDAITFYHNLPQQIQYEEIAVLHIGNCPQEFTVAKRRKVEYYTQDEWAAIYGDRYIIAENADGHSLFACTYNEEVYQLLVQRCSETASCLFDEAAYEIIAEKKRRRREIEQQTFAEKGGQEILDRYQGYIN